MPCELIRTITSAEGAVRDRSLEELCRNASSSQLLSYCDELDRFRRSSDNLYAAAVLEHLKNNPEWAVIPTVVLTGSADLDDIKKA